MSKEKPRTPVTEGLDTRWPNWEERQKESARIHRDLSLEIEGGYTPEEYDTYIRSYKMVEADE